MKKSLLFDKVKLVCSNDLMYKLRILKIMQLNSVKAFILNKLYFLDCIMQNICFNILFRSLLFNICFFSAIFIAVVLFYPVVFLPRKTVIRYWYYLACVLKYITENIAGIKCKIEGLENFKDKNVIYASRHESLWETMFLVYFFKHGMFIVKKELVDIPFFGAFLKKIGMIDVDRERGVKSLINVIEKSRRIMSEEHPIIIFPEGTRCKTNHPVVIKKGISLIYNKLNVPVIPIVLNSGKFWPRRGFIKHPGTVTLKLLHPIAPGMTVAEFSKKLEDVLNDGIKSL